jgi:hypothetical protein
MELDRTVCPVGKWRQLVEASVARMEFADLFVRSVNGGKLATALSPKLKKQW